MMNLHPGEGRNPRLSEREAEYCLDSLSGTMVLEAQVAVVLVTRAQVRGWNGGATNTVHFVL